MELERHADGEIRRADGVPPLALLGAEDLGQWMGSRPSRLRVAGVVRGGAGSVVLDIHATPAWRARGGCTSLHLRLRRYGPSSLLSRLRARFLPPRSKSRAAREWNLLCRLRACGVAVPEPLALGEGRAALFTDRSFLLSGERPRTRPLEEWCTEGADPRARRAAARALGRMLRALVEAGVELPGLRPAELVIDPAEAEDDCSALARSGVDGRALRRWPECGLLDVSRARQTARRARGSRAADCARLLGSLVRAGPGRLEVEAGELARVFREATRFVLTRAERRRLLARLCESLAAWGVGACRPRQESASRAGAARTGS